MPFGHGSIDGAFTTGGSIMLTYREVVEAEATAARRRVFFDLRDATDGITPETGEAGGQPQVSVNGAAWTNTGIGTLTAVGNGLYYADLSAADVLLNAHIGNVIHTRYKSSNTAESRGTTVKVVENMDGYSREQIQKISLAVLAGVCTGGGSSSIVWKDPAGANNRVSATVDENGNKTSVTISGSEA